MAEAKELFMTAEGLAKLEAELDELKLVRRKEVAEKIKQALAFGDLSENSEYDEAKNEQAQVEARIIEFEEEEEYSIVGPTEANPSQNKLSYESPIGKALIGKKVGDTVDVQTPGGIVQFKILEIHK